MCEEKRKIPKFNLDLIKPGDILQYKNDGSKFGNLIEKKQLQAGFSFFLSQFIHVEMSGGGKDSVNITFPKAKHIDITKAHKGRYVRVLRYYDLTSEQRSKASWFNALSSGKWYDLSGVGAFIIKWLKENNRHRFCSEGCTEDFQRVSKKVFEGREPHEIYPADYNSLNKFTCICEGIIT